MREVDFRRIDMSRFRPSRPSSARPSSAKPLSSPKLRVAKQPAPPPPGSNVGVWYDGSLHDDKHAPVAQPATRCASSPAVVALGRKIYLEKEVDTDLVQGAWQAHAVSQANVSTAAAPSPAVNVFEYGLPDELQLSLDVALRNCSQHREETVIAQQETLEALGRVQWPNQLASTAARALVVRVSRAAARLRAATERLEQDARTVHFAHMAQSRAAAERTAHIRARLVAQRDVAEAALSSEIHSSEEEFARFNKALRVKTMVKGAASSALEALRKKKEAVPDDSVTGMIGNLTLELAEEKEKTKKLEDRVYELEWAKEKLAAELPTIEARHQAEMAPLHRKIAIQSEELVSSAEARGLLRAELEEAKQAAKDNEHAMRRSFEEADATRISELRRVQREIDRMRAVQKQALAAGSYKGRSIHYIDSLRPPAPRANDTPTIESAFERSAFNWRDIQECETVLKNILERTGPDMEDEPLPRVGVVTGSRRKAKEESTVASAAPVVVNPSNEQFMSEMMAELRTMRAELSNARQEAAKSAAERAAADSAEASQAES